MARIVLPRDPLVDDGTALRPWREDDLGDIAEACRDPLIARWTPVPVPYDDADARAFLLQRDAAIQAELCAPFAIVAADGGAFLGSVALNRIDWDHLRAEVGYWLAPGGRGQGHATRAVRTVSAWGFRTLALERLNLHAATENLASQHVAERAGYTRECVLRSYQAGRLGREDIVAYGLLAGA